MKDYEEIIRQKGLPRVGQTVRSKRFGTLWRIIEKREVWRNINDDPVTQEPRMIPAIYLCFWRIQPGVIPGVGKMLGYTYTLLDDSFETHWEILPEDYQEHDQEPDKAQLTPFAKILEFPSRSSSCLSSRKRPSYAQKSENVREGGKNLGQLLELRMTKRSLYRAATREIFKLYQLSRGGETPIVDESSREAFERGEIEEVRWIDWATYMLHNPDYEPF